MENNKCCPNGDCEKCKGSKMEMCCDYKCCGGKCHILKILISILILAAVFYLGTMVGSDRDSFRKDGEKQKGTLNSGAGSVTVKVLSPTTTPPVTQ